ncbi:MAG TPA: carbohydrate ABC transporter permease [Clostridia bacterium]|nr:carbohydrate ABC transporter permease [Clostridia bacterium]
MKNGKLFNIFIGVVVLFVSSACILPFVLLFISSITDENTIIQYGYSFFPHKLSLAAYGYIMTHASNIFRAYGITVFITAVGTAVSLIITSMLAYPLSRKDLPGNKVFTFLVFFTVLFSGGLVPAYLVYTHLINVKNSLLGLIVPMLLMNGFYVLIMRTFFSSIPKSLIESANLDGAGELRIFASIIIPLSLPVMATVGLFVCINYWNDWFNGMIFLTDSKLYSIQNYLNRILLDIDFLNKNNVSSSQAEILARIPKETVRMALAVIGVVPILIAYPFFQKYFAKGLTVGAIKG